jgi:hypothetical protein
LFPARNPAALVQQQDVICSTIWRFPCAPIFAALWPQAPNPPAESTRKIFMISQTSLLQKPECDESQHHDDVNRDCVCAQDDR